MSDLPRVHFDDLDIGQDQLMVWKGQPFTGVAVEFYADGKPCSEVAHVNGLIHGLSRAWYPSGNLREESQLWYGGLHGYERVWDEQQRLVSERIGELGIGVAEKVWDGQGRLIKDWHIGPADSLYNEWQWRRKQWGPSAPPIDDKK
jgi:hypothetical protein